MKLSSFENDVDPVIVQRGKEYFQTNKIKTVQETIESTFEFKVEGAKMYKVVVKLKEGKDSLLETTCDCPFESGPYCKHQVAAFYFLAENRVDTGDGVVFTSIRLALSNFYKNELIEMLVDLATKYPGERKAILSKYVDNRLYPDLRYLKMSFIEKIESTLKEKRHMDSYQVMDLTDDLAKLVDITSDIKNSETYFNVLLFFYTEVVMLREVTEDTFGSIDALLMYLVYEMKHRQSQPLMITHKQKLEVIISLYLTLDNRLYIKHTTDAVLLLSTFKDHMAEEDARTAFIRIIEKWMTICTKIGDEVNYEKLDELKGYVEMWDV